MTNFKTLAAVALCALVASTSIVSAAGNTFSTGGMLPQPPEPKGQGGDSGVIFIPINVEPDKPTIPYIPVDFGDVGNDEPDIPYIPIGFPMDLPERRNGQDFDATMLVECQVKDKAPTTDDLWVVNVGTADLPVGLKLRFAVPSSGDRGAFQLNRTIGVGEKIKAADLLTGAESGAPCRIQII